MLHSPRRKVSSEKPKISDRMAAVTLRVTGLAADATEGALKIGFASHGYVKSVVILLEGDERVAIVTYDSRTAQEAADEAMQRFGVMPSQPYASAGGLKIRTQEQPRDSTSGRPAGHEQAAAGQTPLMAPPTPMMPPHGAYGGYTGGYCPSYCGTVPPYDHGGNGYWGQPPAPSYYGGMPMPPMGGMGGVGYGAMPGHMGGMGSMPGNMPPGGGRGQGGDQVLSGDETKLFVGGLPAETTDTGLRTLMSPYGNILDIHVMKPSSHTNQRCAFITYEHHICALAATKLSGVHRMNPNDKAIVVRFADKQGDKRQRVG